MRCTFRNKARFKIFLVRVKRSLIVSLNFWRPEFFYDSTQVAHDREFFLLSGSAYNFIKNLLTAIKNVVLLVNI